MLLIPTFASEMSGVLSKLLFLGGNLIART